MYLDSAIIVKLLVAEPDSSIFVAATQDLPIASSELAFTEVAAATKLGIPIFPEALPS